MIIIGDVHGCWNTLKALIKKLPKKEKLCFVGDLIDRGPWSNSVVNSIMLEGIPCVKGNHEEMLTGDPAIWKANGMKQTLMSYNGRMDRKHVDFLKGLPLYLIFDEPDSDGNKLLVSHASACSVWGLPEDDYFRQEITSNRNKNISKIPGFFNVFGHTPVAYPFVDDKCAFIDTGCVYKKKLSAIHWPSKKIYQQDYCD